MDKELLKKTLIQILENQATIAMLVCATETEKGLNDDDFKQCQEGAVTSHQLIKALRK